MNKNISNQEPSSTLQHFCQPSISLNKAFQKDEIKNYASALAKKNVEKRIKSE